MMDEQIIREYALQNRLKYGKADEKNVLGRILARYPEVRNDIKTVIEKVRVAVEEINRLPSSELAHSNVSDKIPLAAKEKDISLEKDPEKVVMRFAPNPSGPLHIGHSRTVVLNDYLVKKYKGKHIIRIEDTDPKRIYEPAYKMILEDLDWLGIARDEIIIQSDRMDIYYEHCRKLIDAEHAYVCDCPEAEFKELKAKGMVCPHRDTNGSKNAELFEKMIKEGREGKLSVKLKTDIAHPNPALRDFPIMRIVKAKHPRINGFRVYPLMNFSVAVDDHLLGITHVLRGKDHLINTLRQRYIYEYLNWSEPVFIHHGLMRITEVISKSKMKRGIEKGEYSGWDDPKLLTLRALRRRGIQPDAIKRYILDLGLKEKDIEFMAENLYAENKRIVENPANRYFFVRDPKELVVHSAPDVVAKVYFHMNAPERGFREFKLTPVGGKTRLFIEGDDARTLESGAVIRLKDLYNVVIRKTGDCIEGEYVAGSLGPKVECSDNTQYSGQKESIKFSARIHWVPEEHIDAVLVSPEGKASGFCEKYCAGIQTGEIIQFERVGFCRLDGKEGDKLCFYFGHR